jgi:DNA-directed RNA polymerase subunit RPC12/RpoP
MEECVICGYRFNVYEEWNEPLTCPQCSSQDLMLIEPTDGGDWEDTYAASLVSGREIEDTVGYDDMMGVK